MNDDDIMEMIGREFVRAMRRRLVRLDLDSDGGKARTIKRFLAWIHDERKQHALLHQFMTVYGRLLNFNNGDSTKAADQQLLLLVDGICDEFEGQHA